MTIHYRASPCLLVANPKAVHPPTGSLGSRHLLLRRTSGPRGQVPIREAPLNAGVPPTQVAAWAGHSVEVLLRIYAKCIDGQDAIAKRRIAEALRETGDASPAPPPGEGGPPLTPGGGAGEC